MHGACYLKLRGPGNDNDEQYIHNAAADTKILKRSAIELKIWAGSNMSTFFHYFVVSMVFKCHYIALYGLRKGNEQKSTLHT
jgi:hypothetical protein